MVNYTYKERGVISRVLYRLVVCFLILFIALMIPTFMAFRAEADVTLFHSDTYREEGVEILDESGSEKRIQYEHFWSDFSGEIPEDVTVANNIFLRFSWTSVTRTVVTESENSTATEAIEVSNDTTTKNELLPQAGYGTESALDTVPSDSGEIRPLDGEGEDVQEVKSSEEMTMPTPTSDTIESSHESEDEETDSEGPVSEPEEDESASETEGFEQVSFHMLYPWASVQLEENGVDENPPVTDVVSAPLEEVSGDVDSVAPHVEDMENTIDTEIVDEAIVVPPQIIYSDMLPEVIIAESISTTSGFVSSDVIVEPLHEKSFEVLYTIDGTTWIMLGSVGFDESREVVYDLSPIGLEGLRNLQIVARYTIPEGDMTKIIFDSLHVEVGSEALLIEEVIEPVGHDDREPNFEVSAIKSDVQSENIRAVVLERGGIFEFWYSVTNTHSGEIVWNKILGGGVIDENAPIDIKKRTIFWLDHNQQTLYGYSVDEESIFATPFQDSENKVFLLPFTDDTGKPWEVIFNSEQNTLEFNRVKS